MTKRLALDSREILDRLVPMTDVEYTTLVDIGNRPNVFNLRKVWNWWSLPNVTVWTLWRWGFVQMSFPGMWLTVTTAGKCAINNYTKIGRDTATGESQLKQWGEVARARQALKHK